MANSDSPYAILCFYHGRVYLSDYEYNQQMQFADARWVCPLCGHIADFDDDTFERACSENVAQQNGEE